MKPLHRLWEEFLLRWARRELPPTHPMLPRILARLSDWQHAPSPLDPADTPVVGACILAVIAVLAFGWLGWL